MATPNRISNKYEFSNRGTLHSFDPNRMVYDNMNGGGKISLLDLHLDLVRQHNSKDVFVIDSRGNIINPDGSFLPYHKPRQAKETRRHR